MALAAAHPENPSRPEAQAQDGEGPDDLLAQHALSARLAPRPAARAEGQRPTRRVESSYAEFLPDVQALSERDHSPAARLLTFAVALVVVVALVWAAVSKVERVAVAPGQVRPAGAVMTVNHPEGGSVSAISVKEGMKVTAGQPLVTLNGELLAEEIGKVAGKQATLMAELARLQAEAEGGLPLFPEELVAERADLVAAQSRLFEARQSSLTSQRTAADRVIEQRRSDLAILDRRIDQLNRSLAILGEQRGATEALMKKGYFPKLRFLSMEREISELEGQLAEARQSRVGASAALEEAADLRAGIDQDWQVKVFDALAATLEEYDANSKLLAQQEARARATVVRAPADGVVQELAVTSIGQAVAPNELLLTLVPDSGNLVIEGRVPDRDIGAVTVGQPVSVKVRTYDFVRYGTIEGRVSRIAADATNDPESQETYFLIQVEATPESLAAAEARGLTLGSGMLVDLDLQIGQRSILSYLTDRLLATTATAFTER